MSFNELNSSEIMLLLGLDFSFTYASWDLCIEKTEGRSVGNLGLVLANIFKVKSMEKQLHIWTSRPLLMTI